MEGPIEGVEISLLNETIGESIRVTDHDRRKSREGGVLIGSRSDERRNGTTTCVSERSH